MGPRERPADKKIERKDPEFDIVTASLERLKLCGLPEIRTTATWADFAITKDETENRALVIPLSVTDKQSLSNTPIRIVMAGNSPDNMHFQLRIDTQGFLDKGTEEIDAQFIPYFFVLAAFEKAVQAESLDIIHQDITYADSYMAVYGQAFELQLKYQEWVNQQAIQKSDAPQVPVFSKVQEHRIRLQEQLQRIVFGTFPKDVPKADFGIHDYLLLLSPNLPALYKRLYENGDPLLPATNLVGNPALQQAFLSELSLLFMLFRRPDESFEEAVVAAIGQDMLQALQHPANLRPLAELLDNSRHPLRSFVYVRAMLFQQIMHHTLALYYSIDMPATNQIREFQDNSVDAVDLRMLGAIASGDLLLDRIDQGFENFGFGKNDRRTG